MKIYVITSGEYSAYNIEYVTTDKKKAELFCAVHNKNNTWDYYEIEEYESDDFDITVSEEKGEPGYLYIFKFILFNNNNNVCHLHISNIYKYITFKKQNTIDALIYGRLYGVNIWIPEENEEKAKKIAYDMMAEYVARKEGIT